MKRPQDEKKFIELKVYLNKRNKQRTIILPKRKMEDKSPKTVKFFPKLNKIKW